MAKPTLVIVGGIPGSGKTTLANRIARAIPCPALSRDHIKEGMVHADASGPPKLRDEVAFRSYDAFAAAIELLIGHGVTTVADAAFRHRLWAPMLEPMLDRVDLRIVHCVITPELAKHRITARITDEPERARSHPDLDYLAAIESGDLRLDDYEPLELDVPTLIVDTTDGYDPPFEEIVRFVS